MWFEAKGFLGSGIAGFGFGKMDPGGRKEVGSADLLVSWVQSEEKGLRNGMGLAHGFSLIVAVLTRRLWEVVPTWAIWRSWL